MLGENVPDILPVKVNESSLRAGRLRERRSYQRKEGKERGRGLSLCQG